MESPSLNRSHWRKSGQWFALQRRHAELVVADTEVAEAFKQYVPTCQTVPHCCTSHAWGAQSTLTTGVAVQCSLVCALACKGAL